MPVKKEICRNFARGSCQFGQRCKFLHASPNNQNAPTNNAHNNTTNNPYGFGVQNKSNTWTRGGSANPTPSASETHKCSSDGESCRRIMAEDFQNERPLWKLTCYAHWKGFPCDVTGDVSFDELRAAAYDDAIRGLPFHSIVERERHLVNTKLIEFQNICKSYRPSQKAVPSFNVAPPSMSSFGVPAFNTVSSSSSSTVPSFGVPSQNATPAFGSSFGVPSQNATPAFGSSFGVPLQNATPAFGSSFGVPSLKPATPPSVSSFGTASLNTAFGPGMLNNSLPTTPAFGFRGSTTPLPASKEDVVVATNETSKVEAVWLKHQWNPGEVPEDAPPDSVCS